MTQNVLPHLQGKTVEEVRSSIKRFPFSIGAFNVAYGVNVGSILRACNVFAATNFLMIGDKKWDRRGSVGVQNYENIVFYSSWQESLKWIRSQNLTPIAVDWVEGKSKPIHLIKEYPTNPIFIMGSEKNGISQEVLESCDLIIHIPQWGSIPSLNVSQAASIIMWDWHNKRINYEKQQND
jgi:tRNA G18 (ribose-2'-O)-methylase SpoU